MRRRTSEVGWELSDGPFVYWQGTIIDIELHYDQASETPETLASPDRGSESGGPS
jgi:hypothetical protein